MSFWRPTQIPTEYPVATPHTFTSFAPSSFPNRPGLSVLLDCRPEGSLTVGNYPHRRISKDACRLCRRQLITFDMIPDDVLLEIFDFYVHEYMYKGSKQNIEVWIKLAHVCQRWRSVVFQSPLRLDLELACTHKTPTRDILETWPPLPLIIHDFYDYDYNSGKPYIEDNIIAALEYNDRVCKIELVYAKLGFFTNSAAILKPFPELTDLELWGSYWKEQEPILPDLFLGGSAPRLRSFILNKVPFPGLPKLLLSSTHLVRLELSRIPRSGYMPPEAMATGLSVLTNLEHLRLEFDHPPPRPVIETRRPPLPPLTRFILSRLTSIEFKGASEYLEVILAWIDTPRLDKLQLTFFNQLVFYTPQLFQFISRSPTLRAPKKANIKFHLTRIIVTFPSQTSNHDVLYLEIGCKPPDWQLLSLEQVCTSSLPHISMLEDLYISNDGYWKPEWQEDENTLWLDFLRPFDAMKNLYISVELVPRIAPALQELVGGRTTEVLPALENIFLQGFQPSRPLQKGIEKFVAARLLTSRPVAVSHWDNWGRW